MEDLIDEQLIATMRKLTASRQELALERETNVSLIELLRLVSQRTAEIGGMIDARLDQMTRPECLSLPPGEEV